MTRIHTVEESQAEGMLKETYAEVERTRGRVANVFKVESLNPAAMRAHLDFYMAIMYGRSGLSRQQREIIAMTVSNQNRCTYCTTHHTEALSKYLKDGDVVRAIRKDFAVAPIGPKEKAMLEYATKVTHSPALVDDSDTDRLREMGFADSDILDITLVASYFNFVNRLVLSLGVELEPDASRTYKY
jgi:uncharacterized peroxidase-related enzyme